MFVYVLVFLWGCFAQWAMMIGSFRLVAQAMSVSVEIDHHLGESVNVLVSIMRLNLHGELGLDNYESHCIKQVIAIVKAERIKTYLSWYCISFSYNETDLPF